MLDGNTVALLLGGRVLDGNTVARLMRGRGLDWNTMARLDVLDWNTVALLIGGRVLEWNTVARLDGRESAGLEHGGEAGRARDCWMGTLKKTSTPLGQQYLPLCVAKGSNLYSIWYLWAVFGTYG